MNVVFFHVTLINNYQEVFDEMYGEMLSSGLVDFVDVVNLVVLGTGDFNVPVHDKVKVLYTSPDINEYEFATLNLLRGHCENNDGNVLYLHLKGLTSNGTNECLKDWRRYMMHFCVTRFDDCVESLNIYDTCGVDLRGKPVLHYSGNFWWARADHVRKLKLFSELPVVLSERHKAEFWICSRVEGNYKSSWDCGIDVYERHLHRYGKEKYIKIDSYDKRRDT